MSPALRRLAIVAAGAAVLVAAFLLLSGGSDTSTTATTTTTTTQRDTIDVRETPTVRVVGAKPQGGVQKLSFKRGGRVAFRVVSDTADEIHVHGYDVHKNVAKGGTASFSFPASIEGRFVVELEGKGEQIARLDVTP